MYRLSVVTALSQQGQSTKLRCGTICQDVSHSVRFTPSDGIVVMQHKSYRRQFMFCYILYTSSDSKKQCFCKIPRKIV